MKDDAQLLKEFNDYKIDTVRRIQGLEAEVAFLRSEAVREKRQKGAGTVVVREETTVPVAKGKKVSG